MSPGYRYSARSAEFYLLLLPMMELSAPAAAFCNSARQDAQFEEPIKLQYPVTQTSADHAVFAKLNTVSFKSLVS